MTIIAPLSTPRNYGVFRFWYFLIFRLPMLDSLSAKLGSALSAVDLQLWGVEFVGSSRNRVLRIYIDKPASSVGIDDCVRATQHLRVYLAAEFPQALECRMEVSSPGIDRVLFTLEQCRSYVGAQVQAQLAQPASDGRKRIRGVLNQASAEGELEVTTAAGTSYKFAFQQLAKIKLLSV